MSFKIKILEKGGTRFKDIPKRDFFFIPKPDSLTQVRPMTIISGHEVTESLKTFEILN